jgi:hypothetical protein
MTVIGALSSFRKRGEMSPHKRACRHMHGKRKPMNENSYRSEPDAGTRYTRAAMRLRRCTVEHPFATIKYRIFGHPRLLMRGLIGAQAGPRHRDDGLQP